MECENATTHRPVILHAKYCWSSSPGTKKWSEIVLAFPFNCIHLHFSGGSCAYGVLNDYPCYFSSKEEEEIKSLLVIGVVHVLWYAQDEVGRGGCNDNFLTLKSWGNAWTKKESEEVSFCSCYTRGVLNH